MTRSVRRSAWLVLAAGAVFPAGLRAQATAPGPPDSQTLRNLEQEGELVGDAGQTVGDALLLIPRQILNGVLESTAYGVVPTDDAKLIERAEDVFPLPANWGLFPRFDLSSESGLAVGANAFYRRQGFGAIATGVYRNSRFWNAGGIAAWQRRAGRSVVKLSLQGTIGSDDARRFFGLGPDPRDDPRAPLVPGATAEFGRYQQRSDSVSAVFGLRTPATLELYYETSYRRRTIEDLPDSAEPLSALFDLGTLPGAGATGEQWYNEVSARYDTRRYRGVLTPGVTAAAYAGLSTGVNGDTSRFGRAGGELFLHVPVFRRNRLLVPHIAVDHAWNRRGDVPISFADYPRHLTFRGVGGRRTILRTDAWVLTPSLEYQWPITYRSQAQLFFDLLAVGPILGEVRWSGTPWAAGLAFEWHSTYRGLGRIFVAGGSEGFRVAVTLSPPVKTNDRLKWN